MPALRSFQWCDNVAFSATTRGKVSGENLLRLLTVNKIDIAVDVTKHPDHRLIDALDICVFFPLKEGHTASVSDIEHLVRRIKKFKEVGKRVLVISYHGRNRAPCLAALASDKKQEVKKLLENPYYFTIEFFRKLVEGEVE